MKNQNIEITRDIMINTIKAMNEEQLTKFIENNRIDFRLWFRVKIDGKEVPWWACEYELDEVRSRYKNVEFERVPYAESWTM